VSTKVYFPGLNGLRFIAALLVVFTHIEQLKGWYRMPPTGMEWALMFGNDAVTLFFALSGFLITYLLLAEQQRTGTIQVRKFYARRILRIWPLYFLMVFVGFALMPLASLEGYSGPNPPRTPEALLGYILFIPNVLVLYFGTQIVGITHLWTIGVEEQFYVTWPLLLRRFARYVPQALLAIVALKVVVSGLDLPAPLARTLMYLRIENMAVGGLGAYLVFTHHRALKMIFKFEKAILLALVATVVLIQSDETTLANLALSIVYTLLIINVACNPHSTVKLEHPILNRLGQMSYGIYMFHLPVIYILIAPLRNSGDLALYTVILVVTVGIAAISYRWFEQPFLRLKEHLAVVESVDNASAEYPKLEAQMQPEGRVGG
jgi:peptidoglycan/LPS O-acetylase OafA/YrhL